MRLHFKIAICRTSFNYSTMRAIWMHKISLNARTFLLKPQIPMVIFTTLWIIICTKLENRPHWPNLIPTAIFMNFEWWKQKWSLSIFFGFAKCQRQSEISSTYYDIYHHGPIITIKLIVWLSLDLWTGWHDGKSSSFDLKISQRCVNHKSIWWTKTSTTDYFKLSYKAIANSN